MELQILNPLETVEWDQVMPLPENQPLIQTGGVTQIQTGGLSNLTPTIGKRLMAKDNNTSNGTPSNQVSYTSHDFDIGSIQENQNSWNFTESLNPKQASAVNEAKTITTLKTINADDIIGEYNLPVVTQIPVEGKDIHYIVLDSIADLQSLNENTAIDKTWSLSSELQFSEEDMTGHNPKVVTGQVTPETTKQLVGPLASVTINKSPCQSSKESNLFDVTPGEFDLLDLIFNDKHDPNDESFKNILKVDNEAKVNSNFTAISSPSTSSASSISEEIIEQQVEGQHEKGKWQQNVKRGRGRPRKPRTEPEAPKRPRGRPATAPEYVEIEYYESSSSMSSDELQEARYRRMRDLNNAASKRCRNSRKRKFQDKETEECLLAARNMELKGVVEELESEVKKFKSELELMIKKNKQQQIQKRSNDTNTPVVAPTSQSYLTNFDPNDLSFLDDINV